MVDRKKFQTQTLCNGLRMHHFPSQIGYTYVGLAIPLGSQNNTGDIVPGSAHFLEHMVIQRSTLHPDYRQFKKWIGLKGGNFGGRTNGFRTLYTLEIPTPHFAEALAGFIGHIYQPSLVEEDIAKHRKIIRSERMRRRYFPAENEIDQYIATQWFDNRPFSLEQVFGDDTDLEAMSPENLSSLHHAAYFSKHSEIIVMGEADISAVIAAFEAVPTHDHPNLAVAYRPIGWTNQSYHEQAFRDTNRCELRFGNICSAVNDPTYQRQLRFAGRYLTNPSTGALHDWIREEKNWSYDLGFKLRNDSKSSQWQLFLPLQNAGQVGEVRNEIKDRVLNAFNDKGLVQQEVERLIGTSVFAYPKVEDVTDSAWSDLQNYGRIVSETEEREVLLGTKWDEVLMQAWQDDIEPALAGGFCAKPLGE